MFPLLGILALFIIVFVLVRSLGQPKSASISGSFFARSLGGIMKVNAQKARTRAREEYRIELTYDRSSISDLERILDDLRHNHQIETYSEEDLAEASRIWGAYVGEVLRRIRSGKWNNRSRHAGKRPMPFVLNRRSEVFPCSWIYRRIKHGPEHSVAAKVREFTENRDNPDYAVKLSSTTD
ncbi:MAG: hypothetical protein O2960_04970 [Verrucomicrobia bacterium]|nr:hypothetical protein [Verrucomicrobiota bacterium]